MSALNERLAREARKLAMECVNGTAPRFEVDSWCGCASAEVVARAKSGGNSTGVMSRYFDGVIDWRGPFVNKAVNLKGGLVSAALFYAADTGTSQHDALVFALLSRADELEALP